MKPIHITFLNGLDIEALAITDAEIIAAIESSLGAQGRGETVIEPRVHLTPDPAVHGHFNVLRGYIGAPVNYAGVKIVSDYVYNNQQGLPSEMGILNLFDPATGMPKAILDATGITEMRTGAMTAVGAKYLARKDSKILGHSARGGVPIGTSGCSTACSISTKSGCISSAGKARRRSSPGWRPISASRCAA